MTLAVITGASGFLGRHVRAELEANGIEMLGVGRRGGASVDRLIDTYEELEDAAVIGRPHQECALIHLAAEPRVGRYNDLEGLMRETNTLSRTLAVLPWRRTIFASSGAIYRPAGADTRLDENAALTDTAYAQCKLSGEQRFLDQGGTALRLTNLMGDGMSDETIIADILKQISTADDVEIELRDCSAVLDLLLVTEAARAIRKTLASDKAKRMSLNIGSGGGVSARALAEIILARHGKRLIQATSQNEEKHMGIVLNSDLAEQAIGWRARQPIEEAISTFIPSAEIQ